MVDFQVTQIAIEKLKEVLAENVGKCVRVFVQGIGWGGPKMGMALDELKDGDEKVTVEGIDFIYNKWDDRYLPDTIIDFQDTYMGKGFVVRSTAPGAC